MAAAEDTSTLKGCEAEELQGSPLKRSQGIMCLSSSRLLPTVTAPDCKADSTVSHSVAAPTCLSVLPLGFSFSVFTANEGQK